MKTSLSFSLPLLADAAAIQSPTSLVPELAADSLVVCPPRTAASTARSMRAASSTPAVVSSSSAAERIAPIGFAMFLPAYRRRRTVNGLEQRRPARMNIPGRGHAEPALERAADVRDDVAEQIVRDDHLELRRGP